MPRNRGAGSLKPLFRAGYRWLSDREAFEPAEARAIKDAMTAEVVFRRAAAANTTTTTTTSSSSKGKAARIITADDADILVEELFTEALKLKAILGRPPYETPALFFSLVKTQVSWTRHARAVNGRVLESFAAALSAAAERHEYVLQWAHRTIMNCQRSMIASAHRPHAVLIVREAQWVGEAPVVIQEWIEFLWEEHPDWAPMKSSGGVYTPFFPQGIGNDDDDDSDDDDDDDDENDGGDKKKYVAGRHRRAKVEDEDEEDEEDDDDNEDEDEDDAHAPQSGVAELSSAMAVRSAPPAPAPRPAAPAVAGSSLSGVSPQRPQLPRDELFPPMAERRTSTKRRPADEEETREGVKKLKLEDRNE